MTNDDNDDDVNDGDFPDTLGEILGATFMATPALNLDLTFAAADSNVDFHRTPLLSSLFHLPRPLTSPKTREFQAQLLHYFSKSDNKSNHHHLLLLLLLRSPPDSQEFLLS